MIETVIQHLNEALTEYQRTVEGLTRVQDAVAVLQTPQEPVTHLENIEGAIETITEVLKYANYDEDYPTYPHNILESCKESLRAAYTAHCADNASAIYEALEARQYTIVYREWGWLTVKATRDSHAVATWIEYQRKSGNNWLVLDIDNIPQEQRTEYLPVKIVDTLRNEKAVAEFTNECQELYAQHTPSYYEVETRLANLTPEQRRLLFNQRAW